MKQQKVNTLKELIAGRFSGNAVIFLICIEERIKNDILCISSLFIFFPLMFAFRLHLAVKCAFSEITSSTVWACRSLLNSIATTLSKGDTKCLSTTSNTMKRCCSLQIEPKQSTTCSQAQLWQPGAQPNIGHQSTPSSSWPDLSKWQQLCAPAAVLLLVLKLASVQLWSRWAPCCRYPLVASLLGRFSVAGWKLPLMWPNRERLSVHKSLEWGAESPPTASRCTRSGCPAAIKLLVLSRNLSEMSRSH